MATNITLKKNSIERAAVLIKPTNRHNDYVIIKIEPSQGGCCCFHCWPSTWEAINKYIYPFGPLKDEGDVLIEKNNDRLVLECHESGPEIIVYLNLITKLVDFIKTVIDLIVTLLKARQNECGNRPCKFKIVKRYQIGKKFKEEVMEIDLPLRSETIKRIEENIVVSFKKKHK